MGHYASEMMCRRCGKCSCVCPYVDTTKKKWIVDGADYQVLQVEDFDKKHRWIKTLSGVMPGCPELLRSEAKLFDTEEEALEYRPQLIEEHIQRAEASIKHVEQRIEQLRLLRDQGSKQ